MIRKQNNGSTQLGAGTRWQLASETTTIIKGYGLLYNFYALDNESGHAPNGWRQPNRQDITAMLAYFADGNSMRSSRGPTDDEPKWDDAAGTDTRGLTLLPAGGRVWEGADFFGRNTEAIIWLEEESAENAYALWVNAAGYEFVSMNKSAGASVRWVRTWQEGDPDSGKIIDIDGNEYGFIRIGNILITTSNAKNITYNNGIDVIPEVQDTEDWADLTTGAWSNYENAADIPEYTVSETVESDYIEPKSGKNAKTNVLQLGNVITHPAAKHTSQVYVISNNIYLRLSIDEGGTIIALNQLQSDIRWMGQYSTSIEYVENDAVEYEGSAYIAKGTTEGNLPTDDTYWNLWVAKGPAGEDGQNGTSGTQIHYTTDEIISPSLGVEGDYVISGYENEGKLYKKIGGTWSYMNIRLQGQPGTNGQDGQNGVDGQDGSNGLSAYEIWIANGNSGTERDFLDSLVGADGQDGEPGPPGPAPGGGALGDIIFKDSDGPVWKPFPKLRGQVFIPHEEGAIFDTVIRAAIANAVDGEVLDFTDWKGDHEIANNAVVINKAITLLFGTINVWMESESRTKHMFEITSSSVAIIGYGRSPNRDTLTGPTRFTMTGSLGGGYHIRTFGASSLTFSGFDLIGVRSAWNQREGTFTGVGGMFIEKPDPDVTSSGNTVNNLIIENVLIKDTVAHAIYVDTPIISRITNVRISGAGRHGIYIKGGTSLVMDGVYVSSAHLAGICLHSVSYAAISASASEYCGIGYWFRSCFAVSLFGSGAESLMNKQSGNVLFGTGNNDSGILNGNGNVIPDCSSTYRDAFRGVGYMISGGRSITLNGPYSINCAVKGDGGDTSVLGCHFWVRSEARSIQILSPRTSRSASADPVTMPGRYDVRIQNDSAEYPRDTVLEYNPKVDGTIIPGSGKPYVTEIDNAADTCPVLNVGVNTLIRYGNTKWAFEKAIIGASDVAFDFGKYDIFRDPTSEPMTGNRTYTIANPVKDKVICIFLPPVGTAVITWPSSVNFLQGILQDGAYNVVYIHCLDDEAPYYVATVSQVIIPT